MKNIILILFITLPFLSISAEWKKIGEEDNIKILSLPPKQGILPFKAVGTINHDINKVLNILINHQTKHQWAPKLEKVIIHEQAGENTYIFSEYYKTPWPATDREFLLKGEIIKKPDGNITLKAHSVESEQKYKAFASKEHIQAKVKYINLHLKKIAPKITEIQFEFYGDMQGWMPLWLMNLIQKKWPLRFIQGLRKHAQKQNEVILTIN